ncbi:MAG TPA: response regulator [Chthonomonadales bacterium]|nr:response regulator [Chthonomonadales bacterium]
MRSQPAVLIVDDEPNFRAVLQAKLARTGFEVVAASDAASALERLAERSVDVILLDIRLPDMNGLAALPRLRALCPAAPAIAMTAYEEESLRQRALLAGADSILYKPFDLEALADRLRLLTGECTRYGVVQAGQGISIRSHRSRELAAAKVLRSWQDTFTVAASAPLDVIAGDSVEALIAGADALYRLDVAVVDASHAGRYVLTMPVAIERLQRRAAPRAPLHVPCSLRADASGAPATEGRTGSTTDISTRGVALVAEGELSVGARASLAFSIPSRAGGLTRLLVDAVVVRSALIDEERPMISRAGLRFASPEDEVVSAIDAYVAGAAAV